MSQASIASFFTKKPIAPAAKGKDAPVEKKVVEPVPMAVEASSTPDSTPEPNKLESKKKVDATPPTNSRKRLRQVESSDSEDDKVEPPTNPVSKSADEDMAPSEDESRPLRQGSTSPEKKKRPPVASPEKKQENTDKSSVKNFFTKQLPAEGAGASAAAAQATETDSKKVSPAPAKSDDRDKDAGQTASGKEDKVASSSKALTNMEKRKAEDKKQREDAVKEKSKSNVGLGGGWGGVTSAKTEAADKDALSDEEDPVDDDDEEGKQELLKSASSFDAGKEATWKKGEPVPYSHLANMFEKVEAITKRLEITAIVTKALRTVIETTPNDLLPCVYLCVNKVAPAHHGIELGLGPQVLTKALGEATGRQTKDIDKDFKLLGDLGKVANKSRSLQRTMFKAKALTVRGVHTSMLQIANMQGKNSGDHKKDKIKGLLVAAQGVEAQYVVRQLQGKMRNGLGEQTVLVALAHAVAQSKGERTKEALDRAVETLKEVYCQLPCYDRVIPELLENPISELPSKCFLQAGIPVKPMLAHPTKGISEVLDRFEGKDFTCEYKYDGERAQVTHDK